MTRIHELFLLKLLLLVGVLGRLGAANTMDDQDESWGRVAESVAASVAAAAANSNLNLDLQCERLELPYCASSMPYNMTRMPNFFDDPSQAIALARASQYERLITSKCSAHLLSYLCELLAPMCFSADITKKFTMILPCRSFCRQVQADCEKQLYQIMMTNSNVQLVRDAFNCSQLPYENNGGDGPCHEIAPLAAPAAGSDASRQGAHVAMHGQPGGHKHQVTSGRPQQQEHNSYRPFMPDVELPITDNTPIDASIIRPGIPSYGRDKPAAPSADKPAAGTSLLLQLQTFGHQLAMALVKYSNVLSILTLLSLLLLLNAKRLRRLGTYLRAGRKGSSSSSASSTGSQRVLASGKPNSGSLAHASKLSMSPSASSRSLVLFAGDGKRNKPSHQIVEASDQLMASLEPSQKLFKAGLDRRTLINLNDTLERDRQALKEVEARYKLLQSKNAELATHNHHPHHHQHHHQYDYIQVANGAHLHQCPPFGQQQQQQPRASRAPFGQQPDEPQVYSNILLSSPSRQVLLFDDETSRPGAQQHELGMHSKLDEVPRLPQGPPPSRSHFITAASMSSPYSAPENASGSMNRRHPFNASGVQQQLDHHEHQRSFQRRASSSRHRGSSRTTTAPTTIPAAYVSSSGASSSSSSSTSGNSSSLAFLPHDSGNNGLLLAAGSCSLSSGPNANQR